MSCDGSTRKFLGHLAAPGGTIATALGGDAALAEQVLQQVYELARTRAAAQIAQRSALGGGAGGAGAKLAALKAQAADAQAETLTLAVFAQMQTLQIRPPAHAKLRAGYRVPLPKKDAQYGGQAVQETVAAISARRALPALAQEVLAAAQRRRSISAITQDERVGRLRCSCCGQFAAAAGHLCPHSATADALNRTLMRRLALPPTAYGSDALDGLIAQARQGPVALRHGLTGEVVTATLDGLPLALAGGFVPDAWRDQPTLALAELPGGRIVPVLNRENLTLAAQRHDALGQAAAAYGLTLAPDATVGGATALPVRRAQPITQTATTTLQGGQDYDLNHFIGTEYRKRADGSNGTPITVGNWTYQVGQRLSDPHAWGSARTSGVEPAPKGGTIGVGRTLVAAVGLLQDGEVVETADGQVQLYDQGRQRLLAIYDPRTNSAGDTDGSPNASAAQMAALIAYRALHPQTASDLALASDLVRLHSGAGTPAAAADGAYIAIKNGLLDGGRTVTLGGQIGTQRCPSCGQFMGDAHHCPVAALPANQPGGASATSDQVLLQGGGSPPLTVQLDAQQLASALAAALPQQPGVVQLDAQQFADALRAGLPQTTLQLDAAALAAALKEGLAATQPPNVTVQLDVQQLADALKAGLPQTTLQLDGAPFAEALRAALAASTLPVGTTAPTPELAELRDAVAAMTQAVTTLAGHPIAAETLPDQAGRPAAPRSEPPPRRPRQGLLRPESLPLTGQEHMLNPVRLPAPDPYLSNVPAVVGGQLDAPLEEYLPDLDPTYEIGETNERILRAMSAAIQAGQRGDAKRSFWSRAFGLYGPAGTGKNTLMRQLAASIQTVDADGNLSQGLNYVEYNVLPDSTLEDALGTVVLEADGQGGTRSRVKLGKLGLALAMGSVVCVNEITRNEKLATALQSALEDGEIIIASPEAGMVRVPVHAASIIGLTWNPGNEGDPDRPAAAPLSRIMPFALPKATAQERQQRLGAFLHQFSDASAAPPQSEQERAARREQQRQLIVRRSYGIPDDLTVSEAELEAAVNFVSDVEALAGNGAMDREIGRNSRTPTGPGDRQLRSFVVLGKTVGWGTAKELFRICCDQDDQFEAQWRLIEERFEAHFGRDGQAAARRAAGTAPQQS